MTSLNREALINQLASSMGVSDFTKTKYEGSHYDASTGTLYCNGLVISKATADKAIKHFELLANKFDMNSPDQREKALMYMCAAESIRMMQKDRLNKKLDSDTKNSK